MWAACGCIACHECIRSDVGGLFCVPEGWWNKVALVDIVYTSCCPRGLVDSLIFCHSVCDFVFSCLLGGRALCTV